MKRKCDQWRFALFASMLLLAVSAWGQGKISVSGTVVDEFGGPLPGASIVEEGTVNGVTTDFDGNYVIEVMAEGAVLLFTYIGYASQEIPVSGNTTINVSMTPSASSLDEVVVVGYGSIKKKDLTGAISQLDAEKVANQSTNSVTDMLRGNIPGLSAGFSNSPKGVSQIQIRGRNTLSAGSSPLVVVDGMIFNGDLSDISPNDIDKIDVMKDASSAAVYGARGTNGVILITTKRGTSDKPMIRVNTSVGWVTDADREKGYSAAAYPNWRSDVFKSINPQNTIDDPGRYDNPDNLPAGVSLDQWLAYDGSQGDPTTVWLTRIGFQDVEKENYLAGRSIDWYDRIITSGFRNEVDLSVSGRKEGINYYWSLGRVSNEDIVKYGKFENLRSRLNLDADITPWLNVGLNTQFAKRNEGFIPLNSGQIVSSSPWGSMYDDEGNLRLSPQDDNGAGAYNTYLDHTFNDRVDLYHTFNSRMFAKVDLPLGFSYEFAYSTRLEFREYFNHASQKSPANVIGSAQRRIDKTSEWQMDNILRWNKVIDKHTFDLTALFYQEKFNWYRTDARAQQFDPNDDLGYHNLGLGAVQTSASNDEQTTGDAIMTRLSYIYDSKYLLTFTSRRDGYSVFGNQNKRADFPSVAGAWTISEEGWFNSKSIDFLKLRASYGLNGNRDLRDSNGNILRYASLSRINSGKYLNVDGSGVVVPVTTFNNSTMENADLQWESTQATNLGLDITLWGGRFESTIDVYQSRTKDLIVERSLPDIIGYTSVLSNLGEIENKGFEFTFSSINIDHENFNWSMNGNFALNRNKIISLYGDTDENGNELDDLTNGWLIGEALDVIWGQEAVGVYQTNEVDLAAEYGVFPGDFKVLDVNDDGQYTIDDNTFQGYRKPRFTWALNNSFTFLKQIDFSFDIYSQWGQKRPMNLAKNNAGFIDRTNWYSGIPYWTADNPTNEYARLFSSNGSANFNVWRDASFIRLNTITIGYRFPERILDKIGIDALKVYGNIRNAAVWAPHWDFFDPEPSNVEGTGGLTSGRRFFTMGVNLSL